VRLSVGNQQQHIEPFSFSPTKYYVVRSDAGGRPHIYVITAKDLPAGYSGLNPALVQIGESGDGLVAKVSHAGKEVIEIPVLELDPSFGQLKPNGEPVDVTTENSLFTTFFALYGNDGAKLLQFYTDGGNSISLGDYTFNCNLDGWARGDGHMEIFIEEDFNPIVSAQCLFMLLDSSLAYNQERQIPGNPAAFDPESFQTARKAYVSEAGQIAKFASMVYLGGVASTNVGSDLVFTVSELSQGNYFAVVGMIPLIGKALSVSGKFQRVLIRNPQGALLAEFSAEQAALIRRAQQENSLSAKMRILADSGEGFNTLQRRMLIESGVLCFPGETVLSTPYGFRKFEDLRVGDRVYSADPETGQVESNRVRRTFRTEDQQCYRVFFDDQFIECTAEHPFFVGGIGWVCARDLSAGDRFLTQEGLYLAVRGPPAVKPPLHRIQRRSRTQP